jgi:hypothetical protein
MRPLVLAACLLMAASAGAADRSFGALQPDRPEAAKAKAERWLKRTDKFDQSAFEKAWDMDAPVLDRVLATFELGSEQARSVMEAARNAADAAPKQVPGVLLDDRQDPFFRANLAVGFARGLTAGRVYEESLAALAFARPEDVVDPASYFFYRAVAEHALMKKDETLKSLNGLLEDVVYAPRRYVAVGQILLADMQTWRGGDDALPTIRRLMDNSGRRLGQARAGTITQDIQKRIVFRLDELIQQKENAAKGTGQANKGACPPGGGRGKVGQDVVSRGPAQESDVTEMAATGKVDEKKLKSVAEAWGTMPEKDRAKAVIAITRDLPARYRVIIEDYFRALSGTKK